MTATTVRVLPRFPASVAGKSGLSVTTQGGVLRIGLDPSSLADSADPTAGGNYTFILNTTTGDFEKAPVASTIVDIATQGEAEAGTDNSALNTPLRTAQQTTARLASEGEAVAGNDNNKLVTPARVRDQVEKSAFSLDDMANAETLAAIINRTGLTPQMLGAKAGDASHHVIINMAIERLIAAGGGTLWMPPVAGGWRLGSTIICHKASQQSSHLKIAGVGDKPIVRWLPTTGDMFAIGDGANPVYDVVIENFRFVAEQARTSGRDFVVRNAGFVHIRQFISSGCWDGYVAENVNTCSIDDFQFIYPQATPSAGTGIAITHAGSGRTDNFDIGRGTVQAFCKGASGLTISGATYTVNTQRLGLLGVNRGLQTVASGGFAPQFIRFNILEVDRATNMAVVLDAGRDIAFTDCDLMNTSGAEGVDADVFAVYVAAPVDGVTFTAGRYGLCRDHAMVLLGKNIRLISPKIIEFGKAVPGASYGIYCGSTLDGLWVNGAVVDGAGIGNRAVAIDGSAKNGRLRDIGWRGCAGYKTGSGTAFADDGGFELV